MMSPIPTRREILRVFYGNRIVYQTGGFYCELSADAIDRERERDLIVGCHQKNRMTWVRCQALSQTSSSNPAADEEPEIGLDDCDVLDASVGRPPNSPSLGEANDKLSCACRTDC